MIKINTELGNVEDSFALNYTTSGQSSFSVLMSTDVARGRDPEEADTVRRIDRLGCLDIIEKEKGTIRFFITRRFEQAEKNGYVYLVSCDGFSKLDGLSLDEILAKFGSTEDWERRRMQLNAMRPFVLSPLKVWETPSAWQDECIIRIATRPFNVHQSLQSMKGPRELVRLPMDLAKDIVGTNTVLALRKVLFPLILEQNFIAPALKKATGRWLDGMTDEIELPIY